MKVLVFEIRVVGSATIELRSWLEGQKRATAYHHGEFSTMGEIVESVNARKDFLGVTKTLGEMR